MQGAAWIYEVPYAAYELRSEYQPAIVRMTIQASFLAETRQRYIDCSLDSILFLLNPVI
jgi:hypothetical protein